MLYLTFNPFTRLIAEYEIVPLKRSNSLKVSKRGRNGEVPSDSQRLAFNFRAFGGDYNLDLKKNRRLISPYIMLTKRNGGGEAEWFGETGDRSRFDDCHFENDDETENAASFSNCGDNENAAENPVRGVLFTHEHMIEVHPLTDKLQSIVQNYHRKASNYTEESDFSLVSRRPVDRAEEHLWSRLGGGKRVKRSKVEDAKHNLELAIFVDKCLHDRYFQYFHNENQIIDFITCYMGAVNALFHLDSLGSAKVRLTIVRIDVWLETPLEHSRQLTDKEGQVMYESFCAYQADLLKAVPDDIKDKGHWDLALMLSCVDFYSSASRSYVTMGLSFVGGICIAPYSCVIAELGTRMENGAAYPSTGLGSVLVTAHEIAHNLGASHDKTCAQEYIMSSKRGRKGKTTWSSCTRKALEQAIGDGNWHCLEDEPQMKNPEYEIHLAPPGLDTDADEQCRMFDLKQHAECINAYTPEVCKVIKCRRDTNPSGEMASPALEGTLCGLDEYCDAGVCTADPNFPTGSSAPTWSQWKPGGCQSGCIEESTGYEFSTRHCKGQGCRGPTLTFNFCPDDSICSTRRTIVDYGMEQCDKFARYQSINQLISAITIHY